LYLFVSVNTDIIKYKNIKVTKCDDTKDSFYEEMERVFDQFSKYHMKVLLADFNAKVGREDKFKAVIESKNLLETINANGIRVA
jgi:hypothetical protein